MRVVLSQSDFLKIQWEVFLSSQSGSGFVQEMYMLLVPGQERQ